MAAKRRRSKGHCGEGTELKKGKGEGEGENMEEVKKKPLDFDGVGQASRIGFSVNRLRSFRKKMSRMRRRRREEGVECDRVSANGKTPTNRQNGIDNDSGSECESDSDSESEEEEGDDLPEEVEDPSLAPAPRFEPRAEEKRKDLKRVARIFCRVCGKYDVPGLLLVSNGSGGRWKRVALSLLIDIGNLQIVIDLHPLFHRNISFDSSLVPSLSPFRLSFPPPPRPSLSALLSLHLSPSLIAKHKALF